MFFLAFIYVAISLYYELCITGGGKPPPYSPVLIILYHDLYVIAGLTRNLIISYFKNFFLTFPTPYPTMRYLARNTDPKGGLYMIKLNGKMVVIH